MTSDKKWRDNFDKMILGGKLWYESDALDEAQAKIESQKQIIEKLKGALDYYTNSQKAGSYTGMAEITLKEVEEMETT